MAKNKKTEQKGISAEKKIGIGIVLTAAAASAIGSYFLYGSKDAEKNRKKVKGWMLKAKGEVLEQLEKTKHLTYDEYVQIIGQVGSVYAGLQDTSKKDIQDFTTEMKSYWEALKEEVGSTAKKPAKKASVKKPAAKKTTKKSTAKTSTKKTPAKKTTTKSPAKSTTKKTAKK